MAYLRVQHSIEKLRRRLPLIVGALMVAASSASSASAPSLSASMRDYRVDKLAVEHWFDAHPDQFSNRSYASTSVGASTYGYSPKNAVAKKQTNPDIQFSGNLIIFEPDPAETENAPDAQEEMLRLAQTMGILRTQLQAGGYAKSIYEPQVEHFEDKAVKAISAGRPNPINNDRAMRQLVEDIDRSRLKADANLPSLRYRPVAFAAYVRPVILRSKPQGGAVWIITDLRFEVCRQEVPDPYNLNACRQWREADASNPMYLAGTYDFQVRWQGGRSARGQRTIYNDQSDKPIVYVLP